MTRKLVRNLRLLHGFVAGVFLGLMTVINVITCHPTAGILGGRMFTSRDKESPSRSLQEYKSSSNVWLEMDTGTPMTARQIVHRAYKETFADQQSFCPDRVDFRTCVVAKAKERGTIRPWWFQTMLRDAAPAPLRAANNSTKLKKLW
jgi:hypothetical protein